MGGKLRDEPQSLLSAGGLPKQIESVPLVYGLRQALPIERVIVGDNDAYGNELVAAQAKDPYPYLGR